MIPYDINFNNDVSRETIIRHYLLFCVSRETLSILKKLDLP